MPEALAGRALDGVLRELRGGSWADARKLCESGKVWIAGEQITSPTRYVRAGAVIEIHMRSPHPKVARVMAAEAELFAFVDPTVAVVKKPAGMSSVPFGDEPSDEVTLDALVREALARRDALRGRAPLGVVQRLDKETSGLLVFTRTLAAKKALGQQLRVHSVHRRYLAIAHGEVREGTIRSHLIDDRGDGLRGSSEYRTARGGRGPAREGQLAITHIEVLERLEGATLIACRLETGRTHQIRVHLAEDGHPLLGERVYVRDYEAEMIPAPRIMLHAAELGFEHPSDEREMRFTMPPPQDFEETLARLRRG